MAKPVFYLDPTTAAHLQLGLTRLEGWLPYEIRRGEAPKGAQRLHLKLDGEGPALRIQGADLFISGRIPAHVYRILGLLAGQVRAGGKLKPVSERADFETLNAMMDMSRNAVMTPDMLKVYLAHFALMGINQVMLYTESTYEVPGEPYFGYLAGAYRQKELKDLDDHAHAIGIELVPCIQTLAHLARVLQWPGYGPIKDTETVMMVDEKATEVFIEKMITAASAPFRTKRIHVGMDEAWDLGLGNYLRKNGYTNPHAMISRHLKRVAAICEKKGLRPMMWSDMFFRAGSKTGNYYDLDAKIPESTVKSIPKNMQQVYWDYYHFDQAFYEKFIEKHKAFGSMPLMATGGQTWTRFWTHYEYAFTTLKPCVEACRKKGVKEILMTLWGDDGAECSWASLLPVMQYFANGAYAQNWDERFLTETLSGTCDMDWPTWKAAGELDHLKGFDGPRSNNNLSKFLLWEDPLIGLHQMSVKDKPVAAHFKKISERLKSVTKAKGRFDEHLLVAKHLSEILAIKGDLPTRIRKAYLKRDKKGLGQLRSELATVATSVKALASTHRRLWHDQNNPLGWEVLESRYGGLLARLEGARGRLADFLADRVENLAELDEERLPATGQAKDRLPTLGYLPSYSSQLKPLNWGPL